MTYLKNPTIGIKLTPEVKNKIKGIAPEIKTSGKMFEVKQKKLNQKFLNHLLFQGKPEFAGNLATAAEKGDRNSY